MSGVAPPSPGASPSMPSFFGSPSTAAGMGGTATAASPSNLMQQFERRRVLQCMLHSKAFEGEGLLYPHLRFSIPALLHSCASPFLPFLVCCVPHDFAPVRAQAWSERMRLLWWTRVTCVGSTLGRC